MATSNCAALRILLNIVQVFVSPRRLVLVVTLKVPGCVNFRSGCLRVAVEIDGVPLSLPLGP
jgi:hypothetical protein